MILFMQKRDEICTDTLIDGIRHEIREHGCQKSLKSSD